MKKEIDKMYEQEPKTWYAKILVALIVAALLAWSMSTVQSGTTGGDGLTVAGKIISGIFHPGLPENPDSPYRKVKSFPLPAAVYLCI